MKDVVKDLDCASVEEGELVNLYVTHQLSDGDAEAFEKHYFGCETCWNERTFWERLLRLRLKNFL